MRKNIFRKMVFCFAVFAVLLFSSCQNQESRNLESDADMGERLLLALYDFNPADLVTQDNLLREILSEELFRLYALSFDQRQLNAYLRFQNERAFPHILYNQGGRLLFWMETPHIAQDRTFQLEFKHNGEYVTEINESEIFFLPPSSRRFFE